jgi:hypothetical protein
VYANFLGGRLARYLHTARCVPAYVRNYYHLRKSLQWVYGYVYPYICMYLI